MHIFFSGADYLSDNEDFTMNIFNDYESPMTARKKFNSSDGLSR